MRHSHKINLPHQETWSLPHWAKLVLVFAIYFGAAKFGLKMDAVSGFATLVWPPTGIALAVLLLYGYGLWPGIFFGAFFVNVITGAPILVACGIATGNTLEAVAGAFLLQRFADFHKPLDRIKDVVSLVVLACCLSTMISATIGVASLWLGNVKSLEGIGVTWRAWWVGDALGDLIVAPLILVWATLDRKPKFDLWHLIESMVLTLLIVTIGFIIFSDTTRLVFWFFPFVVWGALRFGQTGNVLVVTLISVMALSGTALGFGPFSFGTLRDNLFLLHSFMVGIAITGMTLAASIAERKFAMRATREALQARDEFLSIASHELKTPLTSLRLQIQMTKRKIKPEENLAPSPEALAKVFDVAERQITRLTGLVEDLLDASRIRTGKFSFKFEKANLSDVVKDMVERFSDQLKKAGCSLKTEIEENIVATFDHTRIEQVIDNLLSNVVKYAPGQLVKISLSCTKDGIKLVVEDDGAGIPLEKQSKIFERFERASHSTNVSGLGLGLFIVNEIVKGHNGTVDFEDTNGTGAKFTVELPNIEI